MRVRNKTRLVFYYIIDGGPWFYAVLAFRTASVCEEFAWSLEGGCECLIGALPVSAQLLMLVNDWPFREHTHVHKLRGFCAHVRSGLENVGILLVRDMEV